MATSSDVLSVARKYIGTVEKYNNNVLFNTAYYGREVSGNDYPWCAVFCWFCMKEANASDLYYDGKKTALCQTLADWFKKKGQWYTTPKAGDLAFFKFGSSPRYTDHVGFVEELNADGSITTIEGNTSDKNNRNGGMVMNRVRKNGIVGYGRPAYDSESKPPIFTHVYPQKGIDVAAWQKNVTYSALRSAGVKFGVIKIIRKDLQPDKMFETHYKGFTEAGIPIVGVYNYSYATTVEKAKIDAKRVVEILNGRKIPVALDVEDDCQKNLGERLIQIINGYQSVIEKAGLKFFIYTGLPFYESYIGPYISSLNTNQFWIARYPSSQPMKLTDNPPVRKKPNINNLIAWQYTSKGRIESAYSGVLDFDILYSSIIENTHKRGVCTANSLRIRNTPSTSGDIVGYLKKGDEVTIYGRDAQTDWYRISENEPKWVSCIYISI